MQLTSEARQLLVDSYVALRRGDTAPGSRVAYRMTVRQLEALVRLSEAIARCHLDDEVTFIAIETTCNILIFQNLNDKFNSKLCVISGSPTTCSCSNETSENFSNQASLARS